MIEPGQKFKCYHKRKSEVINGITVDHHLRLDGEDMSGEVAYNGYIFTCEKVVDGGRRGIYLEAEGFELRRDCFVFRSVKE